MTDLGRHRFAQRLVSVIKVLGAIGEVDLTDDTRRRGRYRHLRFDVAAPDGRRADASFGHEEWWELRQARYRLTRYHYDYRDHIHGGRVGYHWHAVGGRHPVHHAHCDSPAGPDLPEHLRLYGVSLFEAHEDFVRLYASGDPIDCSGFRPLMSSPIRPQGRAAASDRG